MGEAVRQSLCHAGPGALMSGIGRCSQQIPASRSAEAMSCTPNPAISVSSVSEMTIWAPQAFNALTSVIKSRSQSFPTEEGPLRPGHRVMPTRPEARGKLSIFNGWDWEVRNLLTFVGVLDDLLHLGLGQSFVGHPTSRSGGVGIACSLRV